MNKFWIVALETFKRNVKSPMFLVMLLGPILFVGIVGFSGYIGAMFEDRGQVAVVSEEPMIREAFLGQTNLEVDKEIVTLDEAKQALKDEDIEGYLVISQTIDTQKVTGKYVGTTSLGTNDMLETNQALSTIQLGIESQKLGLSEEDITNLLGQVSIEQETVTVENGELVTKKDDKVAMMFVSLASTMLMYILSLLYAQIVASEVASEKGTRIMEIILSSTTASKHFYGKIMGIFLVMMTQLSLYGICIAIAWPFIMKLEMVKSALEFVSLDKIVQALFGYNLLFLILGVIIYTIAAAFCGSLVSKPEDVGKAIFPITMLIMIGFFLNFGIGLNNPNSVLLKVTSFIPFISSFTMPQRLAGAAPSDIEVWISLAILVLSTLGLLKVSATLYKSTSLVYSDNTWKTFKQSWKAD